MNLSLSTLWQWESAQKPVGLGFTETEAAQTTPQLMALLWLKYFTSKKEQQ